MVALIICLQMLIDDNDTLLLMWRVTLHKETQHSVTMKLF